MDAWSGDHMGFYSSLGAVNRSTDPGRRSYAATGYLRPNLNRPNLKCLVEALVTKITLSGNAATGVEFLDTDGKKHTVKASKEVILSGGVINSPQILELSGIGDPEVLKAAGVDCLVENKRVGANFQDHVLGGMLYDLADGVQSLDAMHGDEFAKAATQMYEKDQNGPLGSPGMLMGFVSYASLVGKDKVEETIKEIRKNSRAKTDFEKRQEVRDNGGRRPPHSFVPILASLEFPLRSFQHNFTGLVNQNVFKTPSRPSSFTRGLSSHCYMH